ncbi:hypothetical protein ESCO_000149 [Escovopsis weberi]|uniref:Uncharacterized protein n=1 Tax=Escovopsis weberi TaxID=150374 RepID=A0A0N0RTD4_ESCWE|nr:hypothetical protein ESCO_000149 [Escovopsis weberi]
MPGPGPGPRPRPRPATVFACTFCHHLTRGPPRLLGRAGRPSCGACAALVLDLSICWGCGEVVVRGDECGVLRVFGLREPADRGGEDGAGAVPGRGGSHSFSYS